MMACGGLKTTTTTHTPDDSAKCAAKGATKTGSTYKQIAWVGHIERIHRNQQIINAALRHIAALVQQAMQHALQRTLKHVQQHPCQIEFRA